MVKFKKRKEYSPGTLLIFYYAAAIFIGSLLLSLPIASRGKSLGFLDALFTATSAQCVTGLSVVDTGSYFSLFGQLVILLLIQIGGLGITTFSVYLFFYLRKGVSARGRWIIQETLLHSPVASLKELVQKVFLLTFIIEGIGTLLLSITFVPQFGWLKGGYYALFHSVSAFCNAGFSLFPDSLVQYRDNPLVNFTIMGLIVCGGLGFLVMRELIDKVKKKKRRRLSLHSRLVLLTTTVLIVGGTLLIYILEYPSTLSHLGAGEGFLTVLFQSITTRTAGFNTINFNDFETPTLFFMMFLMFVGASPGSSGGGIKTTSLALFIAVLYSRLRGDTHTSIFRRTIPDGIATKTLTLIMLAGLVLFAATFALLTVQLWGQSFAASHGGFMDYTFEAVSAFATVGLSLGATATLVPLGKIIIIFLMFIGRVGLLTIAFTIVSRTRNNTVHYAEENIMIG